MDPDALARRYYDALIEFLHRYDAPGGAEGGPPTQAEEDAIVAAAPPQEDQNRLTVYGHIKMRGLRFLSAHAAARAVDRIRTSTSLEQVACAMREIPFCMRVYREVYLPCHRRFVAAADLDALLEPFRSIVDKTEFELQCHGVTEAVLMGAETDDRGRLAAHLRDVCASSPYRGEDKDEAFEEIQHDMRKVRERKRPRTVEEEVPLLEETMAEIKRGVEEAIGLIEQTHPLLLQGAPLCCTEILLPLACTSILTLLTSMEDANAPSARASELCTQVRALRARTHAHNRHVTRDDFMVHATDLLLWELELRLDGLLYESRAEAAAMALQARLGRESRLGGLDYNTMRMIAQYVEAPERVPKHASAFPAYPLV